MDSMLDIHGRQVPCRLEDGSGSCRRSSSNEMGALIVEALVGAIHFPIATLVHSVIIVISQTLTEISVELADQRAEKRVQIRSTIARRVNDYLMSLDQDGAWDPEIKEILRSALMDDLKSELTRQSQAWC
jgi:hypothetical protein